MRTHNYKFIAFVFTIILGLMFFLPNLDNQQLTKENRTDRVRPTSSPKAGIEAKKGRWEYFHRMLRDPATGEIPKGIRQKELAFAKELQEKRNSLNKTANIMDLGWKEAGPNDVGGRTRALAIDITDPNTIIAGGVSGGIWKSTNKGATWQMKSTTNQILSVTTVAQDPRSGYTNNWYYGTGEFFWGNSAQDRGEYAMFHGDGIYKSTDNGETWNILPITSGSDPTGWDKSFDFVTKIMVHPISGNVYIATHGQGIFKSSDGGASFDLLVGGHREHIFSDIDISSNGTIVIVLSVPFNNYTAQNSPGVYLSNNEGDSWSNITPSTFPSTNYRSLIEIAPSNENMAYLLTYTWELIDNKYDDMRFFKLNLSNGSSEERTQNLPNFGNDWHDYIETQDNYNLVMAVKPDDENFVLIGATSLFRSTNGFNSKPSDVRLDWIGGYNLNTFFYPNFHPDIHSYAFDPTNPNAMWWGHDGGLSYTNDIRNTSYPQIFPWENKNNGYNVTQFYTIAIPDEAGDNRIMGGTQDNGTPSFRFDGSNTTKSNDISTGDGAYAYFGENYPYVCAQNGAVLRAEYDDQGNPVKETGNWSNITPKDAHSQLFVTPFAVDPNNENIMYYAAASELWRNTQLNSLPYNATFASGITDGWSKLENFTVPSGFNISALTVSISNPNHRLYYAASMDAYVKNPLPPKIYRVDNSNSAVSGGVDISIPNLENGVYVHDIAINPENGNEILVILSNYHIKGIYYSNNGGQSYTTVEGNLEGTTNNPGPSIRAATILPTSNGILYLVATSTGVYSTSQLNGAQTIWNLEGSNTIGNVVVETITSRKSDGRIVAGTHGRGAFAGQGEVAGAAVATTNVSSLTLQSRPGQTGSTSFVLSNDGEATLNYNISVTGNFGNSLPKTAETKYCLNKADINSKQYEKFRRGSRTKNSFSGKVESTNKYNSSPNIPSEMAGDDILFLDDGTSSADEYIGHGDGTSVYWYNEFNISGFSFALDAFRFNMRTESAFSNDIYAAVYDQSGAVLSEGYLTLGLASTGSWYEITLTPALNFNDGETFAIEIGSTSFIPNPAGVDFNAQIKNKSFFYNWWTGSYDNLNTLSRYENGAFLIRAVGTKGGGGGGNQDPVAVANISKTQAEVNETITFDGSQSYDNDGNITQYMWNFGDGFTSTQPTATHAYSQPNTYNYSLTVTDNANATGLKTGQIIVSAVSNDYVTVNPSTGSIQPGGSQTITLTLDAQNIQEGQYTGQVTISGNGGNIIIPIDYLVDVEQLTSVPTEFSLSQNYPNPFNPSTSIEFSLPRSTEVSLRVFDMLGKEVVTLVNENKSTGSYRVSFDGSNLASGVYVYRLETDKFIDTKKLVLLK